MKPGPMMGGVLLAMVAAVCVAATAVPARAEPWHCPPGLAKKGACVPPGLRRPVVTPAPVIVRPAPVIVQPAPVVVVQPAPVVVYAPGDYIPPTVAYRRVYHEQYGLPRPQPGNFYARIGGDIYLLAEATQRVIEAINLVDAATR